MQPVQEKCKIGSRFWSYTIVLEAEVLGCFFFWCPFEAKGRISDDGIELRLVCRIRIIQEWPFVGERISMKDLELRVLDSVQNHIHTSQVVCGNIQLLPVDTTDTIPHLLADIEQK